MAHVLALPGAGVAGALRPEEDRPGPAVIVVQDPVSWRGAPEAWRAGTEAMLARDPRSTRVVLLHRTRPDVRLEGPTPELPGPLAETWQAALARAPIRSEHDAPARPTAPGTLAEAILSAWRAVFPGRTFGPAVTNARRITLPVAGFALVVEPAEHAVEPMAVGRHLAVRVQGEPWPVALVDQLARLVLALDQQGLAFAPEGNRVELFISSACNLRCSFCVENERISKRSFMAWDVLEARVRAYAERGVQLVQFMGGEATVHPRFADALRLCKELGLRTYVITNLLAWADRRFAEEVTPLLDEIMVSVHAHGDETGAYVTGGAAWWTRFQRAHANFAAVRGNVRVQAATVLSKSSAPDLEKIAEMVLALGTEQWVMGNGVPVAGARLDTLDESLTLTECSALRPRFEALHAACASRGCALVFFSFPHCVLGPALWDHTHDAELDDQDLSDAAAGSRADVNFWSRNDYAAPKAVTLGRTRVEACRGCARERRCGGHFTDYFARFGVGELKSV